MESLASLYKNHIATLQERTRDALARFKLDALLIHSGELFNVFLDDHPYPFKVNPQFKAWVPVTQVPNCWLLVDGVNKPKLWFYLPVDYWHNVEPLPTSFWTEDVEVIALPKADGIGSLLPAARGNIGYIGPVPERALQLGIEASNINPKGVIDYLHYYRSFKTEYELACMREAQKMAVNGHRAAEEAFRSGMSEFDINIAYLTATGHRDTDVPYSNIVALNEHAAVLHYTKLDHQAPEEMRSFLLDAGADLLACETLPNFSEIEALAELLTAYPRARAWFSFTLRDSEHLSDGTPLRDVVALLAGYPQVVALGINCIALENTTAALQHLHGLTVLPLVVYPNSGEHYDAVSKTWHHHGEHCAQLADYLPQWQAAGARLIGGCCRTTPADIAALKARS